MKNYRRRPAPGRAAGLTLMEVLVVLVIIAIVAGVAVLSTASLGGDTPQERAARRIAGLVQLASENAVMQGHQYGIEIQPHAYRFYTYDGTQWHAIDDDPTFRARKVGDAMLQLQLEGRKIQMPQPASSVGADTATPNDKAATDDANQPRPDILMLSSGELTPFDLTVSGANPKADYHVRGHMNGQVQLVPPDSQDQTP